MSDEELFEGSDVVMQRLAGAPFILPNGRPYAQSSDAVIQGKADGNAMKADFTIVTRQTGVNRQGNKLLIAADQSRGQGLSLDAYNRNPVCFLDHGLRGLSMPIGQSRPLGDPTQPSNVRLYQGKADATIYFSQALPEATLVFALVAEGTLSTASISFLPRKAIAIKAKRKDSQTQSGDDIYDVSPGRWGSWDFIESEMLEWSVVGIPADAGSIRKFLDRGMIGTEKITQSMDFVMRQMADVPPVWAPGWTAETIVKQSSEDRLAGLFETWMNKVNGVLDALGKKVDAPAAPVTTVTQTTPVVAAPFDYTAEFNKIVKQSLDTALQPINQRQQAFEASLKKAMGKVD